jgi:hypothetical protein
MYAEFMFSTGTGLPVQVPVNVLDSNIYQVLYTGQLCQSAGT